MLLFTGVELVIHFDRLYELVIHFDCLWALSKSPHKYLRSILPIYRSNYIYSTELPPLFLDLLSIQVTIF